MRSLILLALLASPADSKPIRAFVAAGPGLPELLRVELGWFASDRLSVEAHAGFPVFNPMAGVGVTAWLLGADQPDRPPTHTLTVSGRARVNVTDPTLLTSRGERLGFTVEITGGYGLLSARGFVLRAQAGALVYADEHDGLAAGPQLVVTLGYAF